MGDSLEHDPYIGDVVVSAEVRLAISDENGRIISLLVGGAKVETRRSSRTPKLGDHPVWDVSLQNIPAGTAPVVRDRKSVV